MKHPVLLTKQGYAKRNRGNGSLNWTTVAKMFPSYREHIYRIRKDFTKLVGLRNKLFIKFGMKLEAE